MTVTLVLLNLVLVAVFVVALRKSDLLGYAQGRASGTSPGSPSA